MRRRVSPEQLARDPEAGIYVVSAHFVARAPAAWMRTPTDIVGAFAVRVPGGWEVTELDKLVVLYLSANATIVCSRSPSNNSSSRPPGSTSTWQAAICSSVAP